MAITKLEKALNFLNDKLKLNFNLYKKSSNQRFKISDMRFATKRLIFIRFVHKLLINDF